MLVAIIILGTFCTFLHSPAVYNTDRVSKGGSRYVTTFYVLCFTALNLVWYILKLGTFLVMETSFSASVLSSKSTCCLSISVLNTQFTFSQSTIVNLS